MAKVIGPAKLRGKVDGKVYYNDGEQELMRSVTSVNKDRIRRDPAFELVRQNNREFGGASTAGALIRHGLGLLCKMVPDRKLPRIFTKVCGRMMGEGVRGKRRIQLAKGALSLEGMCRGADRLVTEETEHGVRVVYGGKIPESEVMVRAVVQYFTLSDLVYDEGMKAYTPVERQRRHTVYGEWSPVRAGSEFVVAPNVWGMLPAHWAGSKDEVVVCAVLVEFGEMIGKGIYELKEGRSWVIAGVRTAALFEEKEARPASLFGQGEEETRISRICTEVGVVWATGEKDTNCTNLHEGGPAQLRCSGQGEEETRISRICTEEGVVWATGEKDTNCTNLHEERTRPASLFGQGEEETRISRICTEEGVVRGKQAVYDS